MAPSGVTANIPQRFRQRPSARQPPAANSSASSTPLQTKDENKRWQDLLSRRQKCKEHYENIKYELEAAEASIKLLDDKKSTTDAKMKRTNGVVHIFPNSFVPKEVVEITEQVASRTTTTTAAAVQMSPQNDVIKLSCSEGSQSSRWTASGNLFYSSPAAAVATTTAASVTSSTVFVLSGSACAQTKNASNSSMTLCNKTKKEVVLNQSQSGCASYKKKLHQRVFNYHDIGFVRHVDVDWIVDLNTRPIPSLVKSHISFAGVTLMTASKRIQQPIFEAEKRICCAFEAKSVNCTTSTSQTAASLNEQSVQLIHFSAMLCENNIALDSCGCIADFSQPQVAQVSCCEDNNLQDFAQIIDLVQLNNTIMETSNDDLQGGKLNEFDGEAADHGASNGFNGCHSRKDDHKSTKASQVLNGVLKFSEEHSKPQLNGINGQVAQNGYSHQEEVVDHGASNGFNGCHRKEDHKSTKIVMESQASQVLNGVLKFSEEQPKPQLNGINGQVAQNGYSHQEEVEDLDRTMNGHNETQVAQNGYNHQQEIEAELEVSSDDDSWEYYSDEEMLLPEIIKPYRSSKDCFSCPYKSELNLNMNPNFEVLRAMQDWIWRMNDKKNSLVRDLNEAFADESQELFKSKVVEIPLYCDKLEAFIGHTEASVDEQEVLHGFFREIQWDKVTLIGLYIKGQRSGIYWQQLDGNAYKVGISDGAKIMTYIYPNLNSAIYGSVDSEDHLRSGQFAQVTELKSYNNGLPVPKVKLFNIGTRYTYDPPSSIVISKSPLLRDPYEQQTCYIDQSTIHPEAGEGIFAKRLLSKGSLVAIFSGVKRRLLSSRNSTASAYNIAVTRGLELDIPDWAISAKKYSATLAHKACHSFTPNAEFENLEHPRFGKVMSIVTSRDIDAGEEIFVSYNYSIWQAPCWYQAQWIEYKRNVENIDERHLAALTLRITKEHGAVITIPSPVETSPRFVPCTKCSRHIGVLEISVACEDCDQWYHIRCTEISPEEMQDNSESFRWSCDVCQIR